MTMFEDMMRSQIAQQIETYKNDIEKMTDEERIQFFNINILAMTDEVHEMLAEAPWKMWSANYGKPEHYNAQAMAGEAADVLCFFFNLLWTAGVKPEQVTYAYEKKLRVNASRQLTGYDVSAEGTKCPVCKRAMDDPSTECRSGYCAGAQS